MYGRTGHRRGHVNAAAPDRQGNLSARELIFHNQAVVGRGIQVTAYEQAYFWFGLGLVNVFPAGDHVEGAGQVQVGIYVKGPPNI